MGRAKRIGGVLNKGFGYVDHIRVVWEAFLIIADIDVKKGDAPIDGTPES